MKECQASFESLKTYLTTIPLLTSSVMEEMLYLYLVISLVVISFVLVREEDGVQRPVYYISQILKDIETRYPKV